MEHLARSGHRVVGIEGVVAPIKEFACERGAVLEVGKAAPGCFTNYAVAELPTLSILHGNFFELLMKELVRAMEKMFGSFDAIYDRGALQSFHPSLRLGYVSVCKWLLRPGGRILLSAPCFERGEGQKGPPYSISEREVLELYTGFKVEVLEREQHEAPAFMQLPDIEMRNMAVKI